MVLKKLLLIAMLAVTVAAIPVGADDKGKARTGASYLWLGTGARAAGMGNCFTAIADDPSALYYNPAGLARPGKHELLLTSSLLEFDRTHYFLGYVYSFPGERGWGENPRRLQVGGLQKGLGFGLITFGVDNIEAYDAFTNRLGTISDKETTLIVGYGQQYDENLSLGASVKHHSQNVSSAQAGGWGFDIGALYSIGQQYRLGLCARNLVDALSWDVSDGFTGATEGYSEKVSEHVVLGGSAELNPRTLVALDLDFTSQQDITWHAGAEYRIIETGILRAGMDGRNPAIGFSFQWENGLFSSSIDYAYRYDIEGFSSLHQFSLTSRFDY